MAQSEDVNRPIEKINELYQSGKFAEVVPLGQQTLVTWEKQFGPDHVNIATASNKLAALYHAQSRYADAEPPYKRALAIRKKALEPDDLEIAESLNDLAALYLDQGRYPEAEPLFNGRWRFAKKRWVPTIPSSHHR
jgi:tetratricopeptide (TPR) repeat protein